VPGKLILCAGPIGNLGDTSPRLGAALAEADVVYAEDTRRVRILLDHLGVTATVRSYFVGNEEARSEEVRARLEAGETIALVSDAGTPAIADPGMSAVRAAEAAGAVVTGIPGPSAVTLAASVSGLPTDRFVFEGFLPRSGGRRSDRIGSLVTEERTTVLFCSPNRLAGDLADLARALGPERRVVVCRELTKLHEEVWKGTLADAPAHWADRRVKGEVTLVLEGGALPAPSLDDAIERVRTLVADGVSPSRAVRRIAEETGVSRRSLYEATVAESDPGDE